MPRSNCPICGIQSTGGKPHNYHKNSARRKGYTQEQVQAWSIQTREQNALVAIICNAVDLARQPDGWQSKPKKSRKEYHQAYYWRHADKRRMQRRVSKSLRRRVRPLIAELCKAVDLGRITAGW